MIMQMLMRVLQAKVVATLQIVALKKRQKTTFRIQKRRENCGSSVRSLLGRHLMHKSAQAESSCLVCQHGVFCAVWLALTWYNEIYVVGTSN
jgi:hypothetical protein